MVHMYRVTWDNWSWSRWIQYPKEPLFRPLTLFYSSYQSKVRIWGCGSGWSTWYTWYTCTGTRGTPGEGLDGFSLPKNPQLDPSHPFVAPTSPKVRICKVAVRSSKVQMGPMLGQIVGGFKMKNFISNNVSI